MPTITTSTGVVLDPDGAWARGLTRAAIANGFRDIVCFLATFPDGSRTYLLAQGQEPIYENASFEAVACYLDMMKLAREAD